jgi:phosphate transport system substrate-binding protein
MKWAAALLLIATSAVANAQSSALKIGGVGAVTHVLPKLSVSFQEEGGTPLQVIPSLGTTGGLSALAAGALDIAVAGRPLRREEIAKGLVAGVAMTTPFIFVTSHRGANDLRTEELPRLYSTARAQWDDGAPIRVLLRPKSDSDTEVLSSLFPGMNEALETARARPDVPTAATDQDNLQLAERLDGSLATSTLTQVLAEKPDLRIVSLDRIMPTVDALEAGRYRYAKTIYVVHNADAPRSVTKFVAFLRSPRAALELRALGSLVQAQ